MRFKMDFSKLPKCGSLPKQHSSRAHPCRHIALVNGRCYYHQGRPIKHGKYSETTKKEHKRNRMFINEIRKSLESLAKIING